MSTAEVAAILGDSERPRAERLVRLQGWRGDDVDRAAEAGQIAQRIGPATCALASVALAATRSVPLGAVVAGTAVVGALAPLHPFESAYGAWSQRRGRPLLPSNRAAKRLGCAVGSVMLGASTVAFATGAPRTGTALAVSLGALATFVSTTNVCVPSVIFISVFGEERSTRANLIELPKTGGSAGTVSPTAA